MPATSSSASAATTPWVRPLPERPPGERGRRGPAPRRPPGGLRSRIHSPARGHLRTRLPTAVCTIYNPPYAEPESQRVFVTALCLFNDTILRAAHRSGFPVIDLRAICTTDEDYANPIEPSSAGGGKIARVICDLATGHDFRRRQAVLLPGLA